MSMKQFGITIPEETAEDFYRCFPNRGVRTVLLRTCIDRLIARAKAKGKDSVWIDDANDLAQRLKIWGD